MIKYTLQCTEIWLLQTSIQQTLENIKSNRYFAVLTLDLSIPFDIK